VTPDQWLDEVCRHRLVANDLTNTRARKFVGLACREDYTGVEVIRVIGDRAGMEVIQLQVEVPLGQKDLVNDIRQIEQVAVVFKEAHSPSVIPLRDDFPDVSHFNSAPKGVPRSLCLYEESWAEIKFQWTPLQFIERIRTWFEKTAFGELHAHNQPLDPMFLGGSMFTLVVPPLLLSPGYVGCVVISNVDNGNGSELYFLEDVAASENSGRTKIGAAILITTEPTSDDRLRYAPQTLQELVDANERIGEQIIASLKDNLLQMVEQQSPRLDKYLLILLNIPQQRVSDGETESFSTHAFMLDASAGEVGAALGVAQRSPTSEGGQWGQLLVVNPDIDLSKYPVQIGDVRMGFSPELAAEASSKTATSIKIVLIGAGALGSQLAMTLSREGFGSWVIVDKDILLPHNLARHELHAPMLGHTKSSSVAWLIRQLHGQNDIAKSIVCNVLSPGKYHAEFTSAMSEADFIIDASASVAVARWLSHNTDRTCSAVSLFFNPEGCDLVSLSEGREQRRQLDHIEMGYYTELATQEHLARHLTLPSAAILHGTSCREPSVQIPQSRIARLIGRAADIVRQCVDDVESRIQIWHDSDDGQSVILRREVPSISYATINEWNLICSSDILQTFQSNRDVSPERETGGVVAGIWDREYKTIYVTNCIGPPADSVQERYGFIRGSVGLQESLSVLSRKSAGSIGYVGEWHTHPKGHSSHLSEDDKHFLNIMREKTVLEDSPAIMIVVGDDGIRLALLGDDYTVVQDELFKSVTKTISEEKP